MIGEQRLLVIMKMIIMEVDSEEVEVEAIEVVSAVVSEGIEVVSEVVIEVVIEEVSEVAVEEEAGTTITITIKIMTILIKAVRLDQMKHSGNQEDRRNPQSLL